MSLWFTEQERDILSVGYAVDEVLYSKVSDFQKVEVVKTKAYGRMLIIDDFVMLTDEDEFVYHELISHIPMCLHSNPKNIVVIGGGDGGTVRELVKHSQVEKITLCEIDQTVIDVSREFFPSIACGLDHTKLDIRVGDGIAYVQELENEVDLIIVDSTDPIGPGEVLFSQEFYGSVAKALRSGGKMVAQSESPWAESEVLQGIHRNISSGFQNIYPYVGSVPTYPRGLWSWTMASNHIIDPREFDRSRLAGLTDGLRYLTEEGFSAAFALPQFYSRKLQYDY